MKKITIDRRHRGPFGDANGEHIARILGDALRAPVSVKILRPVPVETPIYLYRRGNTAFIRYNDQTVATAEMVAEDDPSQSHEFCVECSVSIAEQAV